MLRIDSDVIAICYGEKEIRIWDLKNQDSGVFRLNEEKGFDSTEIIHCLTYSPKKGIKNNYQLIKFCTISY